MVRVEIGMALSDNEDGDDAAQPTQPLPLAPVKCESESQPAAGAAFNDDGGDYCNNNGHGDEGMKPATTGEELRGLFMPRSHTYNNSTFNEYLAPSNTQAGKACGVSGRATSNLPS